MNHAEPSLKASTHYLKDYQPPDFYVENVDLHFDLYAHETLVHAVLDIKKNPHNTAKDLILDGDELVLVQIALNGITLNTSQYQLNPKQLLILNAPARCRLSLTTRIFPQNNTSLMGLYQSSGNFCTQCEAEGFRRIMYFVDRPDNMARFTTTLSADKAHFPVLLSNGNLTAQGDAANGRHFATWQDPHPKPAYLFALVAGQLVFIEDHFVTCSGRRVLLRIYTQQHNIDKCAHAMASLKKAMRWDEEVYGREYDLDNYMIVAVDDFNMGAMENKGLNIFNSKFVLAKPETATDNDYQGIEGVIAHEYFHNWSGNRVTCRDWFQLSLKEGFTVFRDQEFSADMSARNIKRIHDVNVLRTHQFREDAGPMAHPVRPASYVEINNFYTLTVYNKGAEVIRMLHQLLGSPGFRRGADLYFSRHDGQAVTTDDFIKAMEDANPVNLSQFCLWYSQAGTPELHISRRYDAHKQHYLLTVQQTCPATPQQPHKEAFYIPVALALLDKNGKALPLQLQGEQPEAAVATNRVLVVKHRQEEFCFINIPHEPIPSLLRGFSAPVKLVMERSFEELSFLIAHDDDPFNRWDAAQQLHLRVILDLVQCIQQKRALKLDVDYIKTVANALNSDYPDPALSAEMLSLPAETYVAEFMLVIDPQAIHDAAHFIRQQLAGALRQQFLENYQRLKTHGPYQADPDSIAKRCLKNVCLGYLMELGEEPIETLCIQQYHAADNMTDTISALFFLVNSHCHHRDTALDQFYQRWQHDTLVVDKWLNLQACSGLPHTLEKVRALTQHPAFTLKNPNKVRSLIGGFCHYNQAQFHANDGSGYLFLADYVIQLDATNPQIAARLMTPFTAWKRYDTERKQLMKSQLERILQQKSLSTDVYEIATKSLE